NTWMVRTFPLGPVLVAASLVTGAAPLLLAVASPADASVLVTLCMAVIASGVAVYNINQVSLRQAVTPRRLQGGMNASMRFVVWGTLPLGALLGGFLGEKFGVRPVLWLLGLLGATACLPLLLTGQVRQLQEIPPGTTS